MFLTCLIATHASILTSGHSTVAHAPASLLPERSPTTPYGIFSFGTAL